MIVAWNINKDEPSYKDEDEIRNEEDENVQVDKIKICLVLRHVIFCIQMYNPFLIDYKLELFCEYSTHILKHMTCLN